MLVVCSLLVINSWKCNFYRKIKFYQWQSSSHWAFLSETFNFIKKEILAQVFFREFCEISENTFFHRTPLVAASICWSLVAERNTFFSVLSKRLGKLHSFKHLFHSQIFCFQLTDAFSKSSTPKRFQWAIVLYEFFLQKSQTTFGRKSNLKLFGKFIRSTCARVSYYSKVGGYRPTTLF